MATNISLLNSNNANNINTNFQRVASALQNTVGRDGTTPNQMNSDLDMNSNDILNANSISTETLILNGEDVVPTNVVITDALLSYNNLSDVDDPAQARFNLGITNSELIAINDYGATPESSATENSTSVNISLADAAARLIREMYVPAGTYNVNDNIINSAGVYFNGPGRIKVASTGKPVSFNDLDYGKPVVGYQNLISWHSSLGGLNSVTNIVLHGDSNVEGGPWLSNPLSYPQLLLTEAGRQRGFAPHVFNYGVGGSSIDDLDTSAWIANTDITLAILSFGTNGNIDTYASTLRSKLTAIRAARPFNLGIILKSPPTGTDTYAPNGSFHGRDEDRARRVHDINVQMVQEFNVCAIDSFSSMWYVRGSYGPANMDTLSDYDAVSYRTDAHIHLKDTMNAKVWVDIVAPVVFPDSVGMYNRNNRTVYYNTFDTDFAPFEGNEPSAFKNGKTVFPADIGDGWQHMPGTVWNDKSANSSFQINGGDGVGSIRFGGSTFANTWFTLGLIESTSFTSVNSNVTINNFKVLKSGNQGFFEGRVNLAVATYTRLDVLFVLPITHRPRVGAMGVLSVGGFGSYPVRIDTNGQVIAEQTFAVTGGVTYAGITATYVIS